MLTGAPDPRRHLRVGYRTRYTAGWCCFKHCINFHPLVQLLMLPLPILCSILCCFSLLFTTTVCFHLQWQDLHHLALGFTRPIWGTSDNPHFQYEIQNDGFTTAAISCPAMGWRARTGLAGRLFDTFIFSTELDLLHLRLQELDGLATGWILVESERTHTNLPKKLWWENQGRHELRFQPYLDRIESIVLRGSEIDRLGSFRHAGVYGIEAEQRRAILKGLHRRNIDDGDVFITGDMDEIPNRATAQLLTHCDLFPQDLTLHMPTFIGGFQFHSYEEAKRHTKARMYRHDRVHPQWVSHHGQIGETLILNAGWHCSWCFKTLNQFRFKMKGGVHFDRSRGTKITDDTLNGRICRGEPPLESYYERPESYTFYDVMDRWFKKGDVEGRRSEKGMVLPIALGKGGEGEGLDYLKPGGKCWRERGEAEGVGLETRSYVLK